MGWRVLFPGRNATGPLVLFALSRKATVGNSMAIYRHGKIADKLEVL